MPSTSTSPQQLLQDIPRLFPQQYYDQAYKDYASHNAPDGSIRAIRPGNPYPETSAPSAVLDGYTRTPYGVIPTQNWQRYLALIGQSA